MSDYLRLRHHHSLERLDHKRHTSWSFLLLVEPLFHQMFQDLFPKEHKVISAHEKAEIFYKKTEFRLEFHMIRHRYFLIKMSQLFPGGLHHLNTKNILRRPN